jgi:hypothetical protein
MSGAVRCPWCTRLIRPRRGATRKGTVAHRAPSPLHPQGTSRRHITDRGSETATPAGLGRLPAMSGAVRCPWCTRVFRPRRGGHAQRYCRPSCRRAFHGAARAWVLNAIASGALTLADIRSGSAATRALLSEAEATLPRVRHRPMVLRLEILSNAVDDLRRLGWLDDAAHRSDAGVADAVVGLVERAIALKLRPY